MKKTDIQEKTGQEYLKLADHFIKTQLIEKQIPVTAKAITDGLLACASNYTSGYWRKLRISLAYQQEQGGYQKAADRIRGIKNPATKQGAEKKPKPRPVRQKSFDENDEKRLTEYLTKQRPDREVLAAMMVVKLTGVRPAEIPNLSINGCTVTVIGAKKSHSGTRGADRQMTLSITDALELAVQLNRLNKMPCGVETGISRVQDRLRLACQRIWPRRKSHPTLYSYRHQMGSDLKASGKSRVEIAYLMGHQATDSTTRYGNKRSARGGGRLPGIPEGTDLSAIRENHSEVFPSAHGRFGVPMSSAERMAAAEAKAAPVAPTAPAEKRPSMGQIVSGSPRAADNFKNSLSKNTNSVKGL